MKAIWNGTVLAESEETIFLEGNHYFPPESVDRRYLEQSAMRSVCPWKGLASYFTVEVDGERNQNAAWAYPHPFPWIRKLRNHVAFWGGVEVRD
ncbi:MAG: DUF427 domain-containing protein [Solirubrobacterales bacterium]